ncbi:hypothetical protein N7519_009160 [Penicillium mononematosum]|uniref:uncharacterized protein n=1 Tax=Penicillium mononematosum TaxID=268346 RepID=UPI00254713B1|nr:uncharacterized protein N7519_009160 [Penicillium mononematosum]KAJ6178699.1 hypothetical protein N7519_009160 [Penicillium mononematosum]
MASNRAFTPPDELDLVQLRLLADRMTERNNARADIMRAIVTIRSGYEQVIAHYNRNQLPDVLVMVTNAMDVSIAVLQHRWILCDIEEQGDLECFRLILWRQGGSTGTGA